MANNENNVALILRAQNGDESAKEQLMLENYPLIKSVIRRFKSRGIEYDDLYQLGCVGFVKAINNFNLDFNVKFSTYAVPMIAGEVKRFLRDDGVIKVSRSIKLQARNINEFISKAREENREVPTIDEIAKEFKIEATEVAFIMESGRMPMSLSSRLDEDDEGSAQLQDVVASEVDSEKVINKLMIRDLLEHLNNRDKKIILLRYYMDKTQSEIADMMGVSQVQVSRIENRIINSIRELVNE